MSVEIQKNVHVKINITRSPDPYGASMTGDPLKYIKEERKHRNKFNGKSGVVQEVDGEAVTVRIRQKNYPFYKSELRLAL